MKEPMTAREFALIFWGPIVVIALLIGAWMAVAEYNRTAAQAAESANDIEQQAIDLQQRANNTAPEVAP